MSDGRLADDDSARAPGTDDPGEARRLLRAGRQEHGLPGGVAASFKALRRGEISEYTQLLEDSRRHAIDRMVDNARLMGADAVIAVRFDSSEIGGAVHRDRGLRHRGEGDPTAERVRLSDADRELLFETLTRHAAAGRIGVAELERRVAAIAGAQTHEAATDVMADLPPLPARPRRRRGARGRAGGGATAMRTRRPGWRPPASAFRDPRTNRVMRVWVDAGRGPPLRRRRSSRRGRDSREQPPARGAATSCVPKRHGVVGVGADPVLSGASRCRLAVVFAPAS